MIIFDEKKLSEKILEDKKYTTKNNQGRERCSLVRHLSAQGLDKEEIKKILAGLEIFGCEDLSSAEIDNIHDKIISKASNFEYIHDKQVIIYKSEINKIMELENKNSRNLLFVYLVYYRWASEIFNLSFYSKKDDIMLAMENDKDLWKLAGLYNLRVKNRYMICNELINKGFYRQDNLKMNNYFHLTFLSNGNEEVAFVINNFDNILGELNYYISDKDYKRCENCGIIIKKTSNSKKYCSCCAKKINIKKTLENRKFEVEK